MDFFRSLRVAPRSLRASESYSEIQGLKQHERLAANHCALVEGSEAWMVMLMVTVSMARS